MADAATTQQSKRMWKVIINKEGGDVVWAPVDSTQNTAAFHGAPDAATGRQCKQEWVEESIAKVCPEGGPDMSVHTVGKIMMNMMMTHMRELDCQLGHSMVMEKISAPTPMVMDARSVLSENDNRFLQSSMSSSTWKGRFVAGPRAFEYEATVNNLSGTYTLSESDCCCIPCGSETLKIDIDPSGTSFQAHGPTENCCCHVPWGPDKT